MPIDLLIDVSDIHCGSDVGLAPPSTETKSGNVIGFGNNHHQAWLWDNWESKMIPRVKSIVGKSSAALLVNGDATEGSHHHNQTSLIVADIEIHTNMAVQCLKPLANLAKKIFVTAGTECHTAGMETILAEKLGAVDRIARDKWHMKIHGCEIDASHHMSVTSRAYLEASAMSIQMGNARLNYIRAGHSVPKVFLRAHRHCGGVFSDGSGLFGVTGGWQFLTRHGFKVVTDSIPRPSVLVLDWRGLPPGSLPIPHHIFFDPPQHEIKTV